MSTNAAPTVAGPHRRTPGERHLRFSWSFVALIPVAFALALAVGEGLLSAFGYAVDDTIPFGVVAASAGPALLLMASAPVAAAWYGFKARREGVRRAIVPALIGLVVAVGGIGLNALSYLLIRLTS